MRGLSIQQGPWLGFKSGGCGVDALLAGQATGCCDRVEDWLGAGPAAVFWHSLHILDAGTAGPAQAVWPARGNCGTQNWNVDHSHRSEIRSLLCDTSNIIYIDQSQSTGSAAPAQKVA